MSERETTQGNSKTLDYLRQLSSERFWGSVTLKFEAGTIVHLRKEENLKPDQLGLSDSPRFMNVRT